MNDIVALDIAEPTTTLLLLPPPSLPKSITSVDANDTLLESGVGNSKRIIQFQVCVRTNTCNLNDFTNSTINISDRQNTNN